MRKMAMSAVAELTATGVEETEIPLFVHAVTSMLSSGAVVADILQTRR